jgi:hypothetical protein
MGSILEEMDGRETECHGLVMHVTSNKAKQPPCTEACRDLVACRECPC